MKRTILLALTLAARGPDETRQVEDLTGGDVTRGERAFRKYGCGSCHDVHGDDLAAYLYTFR
jgi:cytochrome c2